MASLQFLKYNPSPFPISQPNFLGKPNSFFSQFSSRKIIHCSPSSNGSRYYMTKRFRFFCAAQDSDKDSKGEEPPESLFMKELRRRGMTPTSLLEEETNTSEYGVNNEIGKEARAFIQRNAVSTEIEKSLANQRERSLKLNSEGLEGLIPRAKLLLTLGGTFFLAFWPLILITVASFSALYFYFGPAFVHDGTQTPISPPQYVDPYALLEEERISTMAPRVN
ncbi:uncharacterized protein LOC115700650 [Cannabis sativa]|uniref:uncharacterized protein LOC115700650 n=1 Tax=Cannabis sativa TaxID=3483 RepID=UPI0029CAA6C4|nr:uncharacterized protein LOC115700650 [Cannabis sativa]